MKPVKTLTLMFALIMAFICFNSPLVIAGDEHPWDEEGPTGDGVETDDPGTGNIPEDGNGELGEVTDFDRIMLDIKMVVWFGDLPNSNTVAIGDIDVK